MNIEGDTKLRVCASILSPERNRKLLQNTRLLILEHILPTTEEFIYLMDSVGVDIHVIIAKPYSVDQKSLSRILSKGFNVIQHSYELLETTNILDDLLQEAISKSKQDGKKIAIIDVGGYFAEPLKRISNTDNSFFAGVVEDTTFGHNRYQNVATELSIPIISVARSRLKEIEGQFVGKDAVLALEHVLRELGISITGRHAVVIGYGMIGKNVARSLKAVDLTVSVHDVRDHRNLKAFMSGFHVNKKTELIRSADIVFAATGWSSTLDGEPALSLDEIVDTLKDNAVLVSVGSKDNEFDIKGLKELARNQVVISEYITKYVLPTANCVYVVKGGTAVNFILPSIPVEVLDLVFAEIAMGTILLLKDPKDYSLGQVHELNEKYWSQIAKDWLRFANHKHI